MDTTKKTPNQSLLASILLLTMAILAIFISNSSVKNFYNEIIHTTISIQINNYGIQKTLILLVNDGFMAIFFLLIGLELKKEFISGIFKDKKQIILPLFGALGGIILPVGIYYLFNYHDSYALEGWAIPAATDIAFAVGVLCLFGSNLKKEIRILLTSIAIFDDLAAVLIIAFFYTPNISLYALIAVLICIIILFIFNKLKITSLAPYLFIGMIMWLFMIKSGVHATLTGFILSLFIPISSLKDPKIRPLDQLEHQLKPLVNFLILPLFAFTNSGIDFSDIGIKGLFHHVSIGIALGLFFGKQIGVFLFCSVLIKLKFASMPKHMNWRTLYGVSVLTGIGFTMSLFIGSLAFEYTGINMIFDERIGILIGSTLSAILGYLILRYDLKK